MMTMNKQQAMSKYSTASCSIISTVPFENNSIKTQGKILFSESIVNGGVLSAEQLNFEECDDDNDDGHDEHEGKWKNKAERGASGRK